MPAETHSHRGPVDRAELERIVHEQLAEILEVDLEAVTNDARLRDDLDADDYALLELAEAVEGELGDRMVGLAIDDEDLADWHTVRDAVECIAAGLEQANDAEVRACPTPPWRCARRAPSRKGSTSSRRCSACSSRTGRCCSRRWRTGHGARRT